MPENQWNLCQYVLGARYRWPAFILDALWCKPLNYKNHMLIVTFFYQNGGSWQLLIDTLMFVHRSNISNIHFYKLLKLWEYFRTGASLKFK